MLFLKAKPSEQKAYWTKCLQAPNKKYSGMKITRKVYYNKNQF